MKSSLKDVPGPLVCVARQKFDAEFPTCSMVDRHYHQEVEHDTDEWVSAWPVNSAGEQIGDVRELHSPPPPANENVAHEPQNEPYDVETTTDPHICLKDDDDDPEVGSY